MRLLAARISGLGVQPEVRDRSSTTAVSDSPFYQLVGATEEVLRNAGTEQADEAFTNWKAIVRRCRRELAEVHRHMESAGVSVELIFDLKKIQACLLRMEAIARVLVATRRSGGSRRSAVVAGTGHCRPAIGSQPTLAAA